MSSVHTSREKERIALKQQEVDFLWIAMAGNETKQTSNMLQRNPDKLKEPRRQNPGSAIHICV